MDDAAVPAVRRPGRIFAATSGLVVGAVRAGRRHASGRWLAGRFTAGESRSAVRLPTAAEPLSRVPAGADLGVPGLGPFITPNADFYRVDTALVAPQVPTDTYRLEVTGLVDRELDVSYADLLERELIERDITLTCVSNQVGGSYVGTARWLGARLDALLDEAGVQSGADQVVGRSVDGYTRRGYAAKAPIKLQSRIDTPRGLAKVPAGRVPVAGVAWEQTVGIDAVEVSIDEGEWQRAELGRVPSADTWVQ